MRQDSGSNQGTVHAGAVGETQREGSSGVERGWPAASGIVRGDGGRRPLSDTSPEAEKVLIELYRRMPPSWKLKQVLDLNRTVELLAMADIRRRHPDADERELRLRLGSRWLDREIMRKVFGWDPEVEGY
jgi:hypothetical protein